MPSHAVALRPADTRTRVRTLVDTILIGAAPQSTAPGLSRRNRTLDLWEMESFLEPTPDPAWLLAVEGFDPLREAI